MSQRPNAASYQHVSCCLFCPFLFISSSVSSHRSFFSLYFSTGSLSKPLLQITHIVSVQTVWRWCFEFRKCDLKADESQTGLSFSSSCYNLSLFFHLFPFPSSPSAPQFSLSWECFCLGGRAQGSLSFLCSISILLSAPFLSLHFFPPSLLHLSLSWSVFPVSEAEDQITQGDS